LIFERKRKIFFNRRWTGWTQMGRDGMKRKIFQTTDFTDGHGWESLRHSFLSVKIREIRGSNSLLGKCWDEEGD